MLHFNILSIIFKSYTQDNFYWRLPESNYYNEIQFFTVIWDVLVDHLHRCVGDRIVGVESESGTSQKFLSRRRNSLEERRAPVSLPSPKLYRCNLQHHRPDSLNVPTMNPNGISSLLLDLFRQSGPHSTKLWW